jgi:hypothetical protein
VGLCGKARTCSPSGYELTGYQFDGSSTPVVVGHHLTIDNGVSGAIHQYAGLPDLESC